MLCRRAHLAAAQRQTATAKPANAQFNNRKLLDCLLRQARVEC